MANDYIHSFRHFIGGGTNEIQPERDRYDYARIAAINIVMYLSQRRERDELRSTAWPAFARVLRASTCAAVTLHRRVRPPAVGTRWPSWDGR